MFHFSKHCSPHPTGLPHKLLQVRHLRLGWRRHLSNSVFPRAARIDCQVSGLHSEECSQQEPVPKQMRAINYTEDIPAFKWAHVFSPAAHMCCCQLPQAGIRHQPCRRAQVCSTRHSGIPDTLNTSQCDAFRESWNATSLQFCSSQVLLPRGQTTMKLADRPHVLNVGLTLRALRYESFSSDSLLRWVEPGGAAQGRLA